MNKDGLPNFGNSEARSMGLSYGRMVLRSASEHLHKHISFLFVDFPSVSSIFAVSGEYSFYFMLLYTQIPCEYSSSNTCHLSVEWLVASP